MKSIISTRRTGKTTSLISMSADGLGTIVVRDSREAKCVRDMANELGLEIPDPITYIMFIRDRRSDTKYLIDNLDRFMKDQFGSSVGAYTLSLKIDSWSNE